MRLTEFHIHILRQARQDFCEESTSGLSTFICHIIADVSKNLIVASNSEARIAEIQIANSDILVYIKAGLAVDGQDNSTLTGWAIDSKVAPELLEQNVVFYNDLCDMIRLSWLDRVIYLYEEQEAARVYSDGSYVDKRGRLFNADGSRNQFDKD